MADQILVCKIRGYNLASKDGSFGLSDPFITIKVNLPNRPPLELFRTEILTQTLNPEWKEIRIPLNKLEGLESTIIIECWDFDTMTDPDSIGYISTTPSDILKKMDLVLLDAKGRSISCGVLKIDRAELKPLSTTTANPSDGSSLGDVQNTCSGGYLHVQVISAQGIPQRQGMITAYASAKVYVSLNFRGQRKCTKVLPQTDPGTPVEWGEELVWGVDTTPSGAEQEHIAVEIYWESKLRDQRVGAVAVNVPISKGIAQQKLWPLEASNKGSPPSGCAIFLRCWMHDTAAPLGSPDASTPDTRELGEPFQEAPVDFRLDNVSTGVYKVNVGILEARGLPARRSGGALSPSVSIQIDNGKKFFTRSITKSGEHAAWYETFSFDVDVKDPLDLRRSKLRLMCQDEGAMSSSVIGSFDVELGYVHSLSDHEIFRQWITLFNFDNPEVKGIQGLLLISASVIGPDDKARIHNDNDVLGISTEDVEGSPGILISPSVERVGALVELRVYRASCLPQMDFTIASALGGQGIDAYVRLKFGGDKYSASTSIVKNRKPTFNEAIYCPVVMPAYSDTIEVSVMDYDCFDSDDYVSTLFFSFQDLMINPQKYSAAQWWNLYGAPPCSDSWPSMPGPGGALARRARAMNRGLRASTAWRGRILLSIHVMHCPLKELRCRAEPIPILALSTNPMDQNGEPKLSQCVLVLKLFHASCLETGNKVHIDVSFGEQVIGASGEHVPVNGTLSWWEIIQGTIQVPMEGWDSTHIAWNSCPDIFVNLRDQRRRIGYTRLDIKSLQAQTESKWLVIHPDEFDGCGPDGGFQGMLLCGANICSESEAANARRLAAQAMAPTPTTLYRLLVHVFLAENLQSSTDAINPYVTISCCGQNWKSKSVRGCQNPAWYESFELDFSSFIERRLVAPLIIRVLQRNEIMNDDVLGFAIVPADSVPGNAERGVAPIWYELLPDPSSAAAPLGSSSSSRILVALQLVDLQEVTCSQCGSTFSKSIQRCSACGAAPMAPLVLNPVPSPALPIMKLCTVEIFIFALRDLLPCGVFPMTSPYVAASISSITLSTRTSDRPSPSSPNLLQSVVFRDVLIPLNHDYAPAITLRANDRRFSGSVFLGSAPMHLAEYIPWVSAEARKNARKVRLEQESSAGWRTTARNTTSVVQNAPESVFRSDLTSSTRTYPSRFKICVNGDIFVLEKSSSELHVDTAEDVPDYMKGRRIEQCELEDVLLDDEEIDPCSKESGLTNYFLVRHVSNSFFSESVPQCSGRLKMHARVYLQGEESIKNQPFIESGMKCSKYVVRLYVLRAEGLASEDSNASSDPFLKVSLGDKEISRREFAKNRCLNPVFHQSFEFETELPGIAILRINVMDADTLSCDDLIGSTAIDLEQRIMSNKWINTGRGDPSRPPLRPIERRNLKLPGSRQARGVLILWVDIFSLHEARLFPMYNITIDPEPYVLRVVIWRVNEARVMDPLTKQNDMYVSGRLVSVDLDGAAFTELRQTDTHWRSKHGFASFNWRWNYPITLPVQDMQLTLQAWDKDIVGSDDLVGEVTLSLKQLVNSAMTSSRAGKTEAFRFPSCDLVSKAMDKTQSKQLSKRDRRMVLRIKQLLKEGKSPESIAAQFQQAQSTEEGQIWTAERVVSMAGEGEAPADVSFITHIIGFFLCICSQISRVTSSGSSVSPNPTVWVPLYCDSRDQVENSRSTSKCWNYVTCAHDSAQAISIDQTSACAGWLELEAELLPRSCFEQQLSGEGRDEPNAYPVMPAPTRVNWSSLWFRPDLIAYELLGPQLFCQMMALALIGTAIVGLVHTMPLIVTNFYTTSQLSSKFPSSWVNISHG